MASLENVSLGGGERRVDFELSKTQCHSQLVFSQPGVCGSDVCVKGGHHFSKAVCHLWSSLEEQGTVEEKGHYAVFKFLL